MLGRQAWGSFGAPYSRRTVDQRAGLAYVTGMTSPLSLSGRIRRRLAEAARRRRFSQALIRVHGHDGFAVPEAAVLAIVLVRDGAYYLDAFFDYYRALGVTHFAFMDNGSTDDTLKRLTHEEGVVVDQARLPLAQYEDLLRAYPAQTYGQNRWCLYVDMDEQFDFEGRETYGMSALLRYLEGRGDTALMAQMLEMFPDAPLRQTQDLTFEAALEAFRFYDLRRVQSHPYHSAAIDFSALLRDNRVPEGATFKFGGVRKRVFNEDCCLTKHPLVFNSPNVMPAPHPHLSSGVQVSDVQAVIRHYKFAGNVMARDGTSAKSGDLAHGEDAARLAILQAQPDVTLYSDAAQRWDGFGPLYTAGFLEASDAYSAFLAEKHS